MRKEIITKESKNVKQLGRILYHDGICYLGYSASEIGFYYTGNRILAQIVTDAWYREDGKRGCIGVLVGEDAEPWKRFELDTEEAEYLIFDREEYAKWRGVAVEKLPEELAVRIVKYSENAFGVAGIRYLTVDDDAKLRALPERGRRIEFIGDSITCGYGVEGVWNVDIFETTQENPMKAYAVRTANALNADYQLVSWSGIGLISDWIPEEQNEPDTTILMPQLYPYTNASLSSRLGIAPDAWDVSGFRPDMVVIYLGTNDASYTRSISEREKMFIDAYLELYRKVRDNYGNDVEIVCCMGIMDRTLCRAISEFAERRREEGDSRLHYVEFEGQREENGIGTDWHPSETTHKIASARLAELCKQWL